MIDVRTTFCGNIIYIVYVNKDLPSPITIKTAEITNRCFHLGELNGYRIHINEDNTGITLNIHDSVIMNSVFNSRQEALSYALELMRIQQLTDYEFKDFIERYTEHGKLLKKSIDDVDPTAFTENIICLRNDLKYLNNMVATDKDAKRVLLDIKKYIATNNIIM